MTHHDPRRSGCCMHFMHSGGSFVRVSEVATDLPSSTSCCKAHVSDMLGMLTSRLTVFMPSRVEDRIPEGSTQANPHCARDVSPMIRRTEH
eukprot:3177027-Amphidinium_carterae.1